VQKHFDQITLHIDGPSGSAIVPLSGSRSSAAKPAFCRLGPGETLEQQVDLLTWTRAASFATPPGNYKIVATFEQSGNQLASDLIGVAVGSCTSPARGLQKVQSPEIWNGALTAPAISITIE
jgi:hypothetical protein